MSQENYQFQTTLPTTRLTATSPFNSAFFAARCRRANLPDRHTQLGATAGRAVSPVEWLNALGMVRTCCGDLRGGKIILLAGPRGTGKTQIAVDVAAGIICEDMPKMEPREPYYIKAMDFFRQIRETFRDDSTLSEVQILMRFIKPCLLIIDEAHERGNTDFESRTLANIIDRRYDEIKNTILITNQSRGEFAKTIGPSVISRMHETGLVVECNWASFRAINSGGTV